MEVQPGLAFFAIGISVQALHRVDRFLGGLPVGLGHKQRLHHLVTGLNFEHSRLPLQRDGEGVVFAPHRVEHAVHLAGFRALQVIHIRDIDGVGALIQEADKQVNIADVLAGDVSAHTHGLARRGDVIGKLHRRHFDLPGPRRARGHTLRRDNRAALACADGHVVVVIGQEVIPQRSLRKAVRHAGVRLRPGYGRAVEGGVGEVDRHARCARFARPVPLGDEELVQAVDHCLGCPTCGAVGTFSLDEVREVAQVDIRCGAIFGEDIGKRLGVGARARHHRLVLILQADREVVHAFHQRGQGREINSGEGDVAPKLCGELAWVYIAGAEQPAHRRALAQKFGAGLCIDDALVFLDVRLYDLAAQHRAILVGISHQFFEETGIGPAECRFGLLRSHGVAGVRL